MPRNFDEERQKDLDFIIRGEKFRMKMVRPEVIGAWEDEPTPEKSIDALAYTSNRIKDFIENSDGSHDRWEALRAREDDPISMGELNELLIWMVEVQSARPTRQPSPSSSGRGRTAASSKAE
jgi:hypothetical protein